MFVKGQSGNPGGRPKEIAIIRDLARSHTALAFEVLVEVASNKRAAAVARVTAANSILDRGWGKPVQPFSNDEENPLFDLKVLDAKLAELLGKVGIATLAAIEGEYQEVRLVESG